MTFILDHLTAVLIGGTLLVALIVVQQRGQQAAVETTLRYQSETLASTFLDTVERDIENTRTMGEMEAAFEGDPSRPARRFSVRRATAPDGTEYTSQFAFPTLADPANGPESEVVIVTYHVTPTGATVDVDGEARPTFTALRYVFHRGDYAPSTEGGSAGLVGFDVVLVSPSGVEATDAADVTETPARVHVALETAARVPARRSHDQALRSPSTATRHARTVYVASARAEGGDPDVDVVQPGGIPALPGDP